MPDVQRCDHRDTSIARWCASCASWCETKRPCRGCLTAEIERLREALQLVKTAPTWKTEDGKRFVFADDLLAAVEHGNG